jgi:hypothetical protein
MSTQDQIRKHKVAQKRQKKYGKTTAGRIKEKKGCPKKG